MRHGLIAVAVVALGGCGGSGPTQPDPGSVRITIEPAPLVLSTAGNTVQFTATARNASGTLMVPQPLFSWSSGLLTVASIAPTGPSTAVATVLARCTDCGTCTRITATADGVVGQTHLAYEGSVAAHPCPAQ